MSIVEDVPEAHPDRPTIKANEQATLLQLRKINMKVKKRRPQASVLSSGDLARAGCSGGYRNAVVAVL